MIASIVIKQILIFILILFLFACQKKEQSFEEKKSHKAPINTISVWVTYWDNSSKQIRLKPSYQVSYNENFQSLVNEFNKSIRSSTFFKGRSDKYIEAQYVQNTHDTVHIKILNNKTLTQQIGSSGAKEYIARLTYTMTEIKGISKVYLDFDPGEHAAPGYYSRKYFEYEF
ncbi:MAG: hypothetical protein EPN22_14865 [Nitrospirae bacterium]|nr:MAG: hypothetical protein EPN22_14865 [Nitrospirota bacterium]